MLSGVNRAAGGAQASAPDRKALEAKRQEILKNAQEEGGAQARAVRTGNRQADATQQFRTTAAPGGTQGGGASGNTGGTASKTQTSGASSQGQSAQNTSTGSGWRERIKRWDAKEETGKQPEANKGAQVDVTA
ncbi:MAG: hypothetical protein EXS64_17905 [Candidatus Latescibacteria bacterium]|nr:hypothetical protein [Candidatus Latescibacterota bacterium]